MIWYYCSHKTVRLRQSSDYNNSNDLPGISLIPVEYALSRKIGLPAEAGAVKIDNGHHNWPYNRLDWRALSMTASFSTIVSEFSLDLSVLLSAY